MNDQVQKKAVFSLS